MDIKILYEYTKTLRVLFVEDNDDNRESMTNLLKTYFLELVSAVDGLDGLEKIATSKTPFDLVISDISMPNLNGIEMAKKILSDNHNMPIIFISAHTDSKYLQGAIEIGVSSFLYKPINHKALEQALFRSGQIIYDHKFVLSHMDMIENLNFQLENKNKELEKKNKELEKSLRVLDVMVSKEQIVNSSKKIKQSSIDSISSESIDIQIEQLVHEDLHELKELHMEIDTCVIRIINSDLDLEINLQTIIEKFIRYTSILTYHNFFTKLSNAMKEFIHVLKDNPIPESLDERENIFMLLETFLFVLAKWQNELESGNKEMINFFDASIINDMNTISSIWIKSSKEDFGEVEFF